jgi:tetratricopeptide (TPR) repeat protein
VLSIVAGTRHRKVVESPYRHASGGWTGCLTRAPSAPSIRVPQRAPLFVTALPTQAPPVADWLDQAHQYCAAGEYTQALALARTAAQAQAVPARQAPALNMMALCLLGLSRAGEAETLWRQCIAADSAFGEAYPNLGALLQSANRLDDTESVYRQWRSCCSTDPGASDALGTLLRERRKLPEAEAVYRDALHEHPGIADLYEGLARALHDQRKFDQAEPAYRTALELSPGRAATAYRLGNVLLAQARFRDAIGAYRHVLSIEPQHADALRQLGEALKHTGHLPEAEKACLLSLAIRADEPTTHITLATVLMALQRLPEAETHLRRAVSLRPESAEAQFNLGIVLTEMKQLDDAISVYRHAIALRPDVAEIYNNLGCVLRDLDRLEEAAEVFRQACTRRPSFAVAAYNLGNVLKELRQFDAAQAAYRRALAAQPAYPEARFGLATLLLSLAQFDEAWALYESRYDHPKFVHHATRALIRCAPWGGESLEGKTLLVWQEDGLGDMLQFGRYLAWLKAQGVTRIEFACMPALKRLFTGAPGIDAVVDHQAALARAEQFNFWVSPLSLPLRLGATFDSRAPADYLRTFAQSNPSLVQKWGERLACAPSPAPTPTSVLTPTPTLSPAPASTLTSTSTSAPTSTPAPTPTRAPAPAQGPVASAPATRRIGLVWKGNPRHHNDAWRSLPSLETLAALSPLRDTIGVEFISLQKGAGEDEARGAAASLPVLALGGEFTDLADTAAVIAQLDLVICVDTSVAHLAGALGKPCWILLPSRDIDWRWMHDRDDSPWYPGTVRLFRQTATERWADVVIRVRQALEETLPR